MTTNNNNELQSDELISAKYALRLDTLQTAREILATKRELLRMVRVLCAKAGCLITQETDTSAYREGLVEATNLLNEVRATFKCAMGFEGDYDPDGPILPEDEEEGVTEPPSE
jgi:hypothetical protein